MKSKQDFKAAPSVVGSLPARIKRTDLPALNDALASLFHELSNAAALYQKDADAGREGVIHSVEWVLRFLELFAPVVSSKLHAPLIGLFNALMSLNDGNVSPLLKPTKRTGRARASALRDAFIGAAAFTVKRLTETGMQAPAAHKVVADTLKALNIKPARGRDPIITARTVREWCERVAADVGRRGEAAKTYALLLKDPRSTAKNEPPAKAQADVLDRLVAAAKKLRAHEGA